MLINVYMTVQLLLENLVMIIKVKIVFQGTTIVSANNFSSGKQFSP